MFRAIAVFVIYALFLCGRVDGPWAGSVIAFLLIYSCSLGIPALLLMAVFKWSSWWQSLFVGAIVTLPLGLILHAGSRIYTLLLFLTIGMAGGLTVWILGIFRNTSFAPPTQKIPWSLAIIPIGAIPLFFYLQALESKWVYGCITDFELSQEPTPNNYAVITVVIDDGVKYQSDIKEVSSNPEILGSCAAGKLEPKANLKGYNYKFVSTSRSKKCSQICPNQKK